MKKFHAILLGFCIFTFSSFAQTFTPITKKVKESRTVAGLKVGDSLPQINNISLLNHDVPNGNFSILKRKLTILDFWNSSCSSCIKLFPHMQQLQNKYGNDIRIVLVNAKSKFWHDDAQKIASILKRSEENSGVKITLPVIYNCEKLDLYFPFQVIPQEVLIDQTGKVIAITYAEELTDEKISAVLRGENVEFKFKSDYDLDPQNQSFFELTGTAGLKAYFSSLLLRGYLAGHSWNGFKTLSNGLITKWYVTNQPLKKIYETVYAKEIGSLPDNRIIAEMQDTSLFRYSNQKGSNNPDSAYFTYEINTPSCTSEKLFRYVQNDLYKMFRTTVKTEKREISCFVVSVMPGKVIAKSNGGKQTYLEQQGSLTKHVTNYPIHELLAEFNKVFFDQPLVDETQLDQNIDLIFPVEMVNQDTIIEALRKAGFTITKEKRVMEVGVITDKTN